MNKVIAILFAASGLAFSQASPAAQRSYHYIREIPFGGEGGWDALVVDPQARRLYLSHATKVVVIDIDQNKIIGEITDTPGVHGIAIAGELKRGFTTNGKESKVSVVDLTTLKTISKVPTGENPDAIVYDPGRKEVYAFNGRGKSVTVIDAAGASVVATIPLPGKPEFAAVDAGAHRVYVNIEDGNTVVAIDTIKHEVAATWPIAPGEGATGLGIDLKHHRLFASCENKMMVMLDATSGKVIGSVPIGEHSDGTDFDSGTDLAFSSNGEGTVSIAHLDTPGKLVAVQTLGTRKGARTLALDTKSHNIYLPAAKYGPVVAGEKRPKIIEGSQVLLVYGSGAK